MNYLVNADKARLIDTISIEKYGMPAIVLMERAAYETAGLICNDIILSDAILVVAGNGNNGGDAIAVGRILFEYGYNVTIYFAGNKEKMSDQCRLQYNIASKSGITIVDEITEYESRFKEYDILVEGLFGVGLKRDISGTYYDIIKAMNICNSKVYSIDIPSGIDASTGQVRGIAVKAAKTVTYGLMKTGLMLHPANEYAGKVIVKEIGFPKRAQNDSQLYELTYDLKDLDKLPVRYKYANKGTYGKVLVVAGSDDMNGAAYLSAKAAYKCGSGLVKIMTCRENIPVLQTMLPEALYTQYSKENVAEEAGWADCIVIGPGIGQKDIAKEMLINIIKLSSCPLIIDADAINLLAYNKDSELTELYDVNSERIIITPHMKEMSRLTGDAISSMKENISEYVLKYCNSFKDIVLVLKDSCTVVSDGKTVYFNSSGNDGMATGGSGDVLTGVIAAYIAGGLDRYEAAKLGVYVHGLAGDKAAAAYNRYYITATDIIDGLAYILSS